MHQRTIILQRLQIEPVGSMSRLFISVIYGKNPKLCLVSSINITQLLWVDNEELLAKRLRRHGPPAVLGRFLQMKNDALHLVIKMLQRCIS